MSEALYRANVLVCGGTGCEASGSGALYDALAQELAQRGLQNEVQLIRTGCRGFCAMGPVMVVYPERDRLIVENINMITKHQRATQTLREPGIIKREGTIHISNVLPICPECDVPTRVGFSVVDGVKMRRCKKCGEIFR